MELKGLFIAPETADAIDNTVLAAVHVPHLFDEKVFPARRLLLVYGHESDNKLECIEKFIRCRFSPAAVNVLCTTVCRFEYCIKSGVQNSIPRVFIVKDTERLLAHNTEESFKRQFSDIRRNFLNHNRLRGRDAIIMLSSVAPTPNHALWDQFEERVWFQLPTDDALRTRIEWNVARMAAHFADKPETVQVEFKPLNVEALMLCTKSHTLGDVDDFFRRVAYEVIRRVSQAPHVVVDDAFIESFKTSRGTHAQSLATHDADSTQWVFSNAAGKQPPVMNDDPEPQTSPVLKRPRLDEEDVFRELGVIPSDEAPVADAVPPEH